MLSCDFRRIVAVALTLTTAFVTMPLSAADFHTPKSVIGSVSAVGPVELRGIGISQEGTLFAGDSIRSGKKGYAKVLLGTGTKMEVGEQTQVNVNRDAEGIKIAMNAGTIGFTARTPLRIEVLPFELTATEDAAGNIDIMGSTRAGIYAINGKVTVRNLKTSESFVLLKGQQMLLSLREDVPASSLAEMASNAPVPPSAPAPRRAPTPRPAPAPQAPPAGRTSSGVAMDTGAWLVVLGGAAIAGVAVYALVKSLDNSDEIDSIKKRIASPSRP